MTETVEKLTSGEVDFTARDGRMVLTFREAPDAPLITASCGYGDCEWIIEAIYAVRKRQPFSRVLRQDVVASEDRRVLFVTITAKRGRLEWEIAAPFGIAGWRFDFSGAELVALHIATHTAIKQEDAKP